MATTVAVVEILIAGLFAAIWMLPAFAFLAGFDWACVHSWLQQYSDWSAAVTVAATMAIYQLGWIVNGFSRAIMRPFATKARDRLHAKDKLDLRRFARPYIK